MPVVGAQLGVAGAAPDTEKLLGRGAVVLVANCSIGHCYGRTPASNSQQSSIGIFRVFAQRKEVQTEKVLLGEPNNLGMSGTTPLRI